MFDSFLVFPDFGKTSGMSAFHVSSLEIIDSESIFDVTFESKTTNNTSYILNFKLNEPAFTCMTTCLGNLRDLRLLNFLRDWRLSNFDNLYFNLTSNSAKTRTMREGYNTMIPSLSESLTQMRFLAFLAVADSFFGLGFGFSFAFSFFWAFSFDTTKSSSAIKKCGKHCQQDSLNNVLPSLNPRSSPDP